MRVYAYPHTHTRRTYICHTHTHTHTYTHTHTPTHTHTHTHTHKHTHTLSRTRNTNTCSHASAWPGELAGEEDLSHLMSLQDYVRLVKSAAAAAHAARSTASEGLDNKQYIALLQDLGVSTKRLEEHFFSSHSNTTIVKDLADETSALGLSMERLGKLSEQRVGTPAITASAPARWRLLGRGMGGAVAAHAVGSDAQLARSVDALVLVEPHAFSLLADARNTDALALDDCRAAADALRAHALAKDWEAWGLAHSRFWLLHGSPECAPLDEGAQGTMTVDALTATHEALAVLNPHASASSSSSSERREHARRTVDALAALNCPKHLVIPASPRPAVARATQALSLLLERHAGFTVHSFAHDKGGGAGTRQGGGRGDAVAGLVESEADRREADLVAQCLLDMVPPPHVP
jgi:hypothetical protein